MEKLNAKLTDKSNEIKELRANMEKMREEMKGYENNESEKKMKMIIKEQEDQLSYKNKTIDNVINNVVKEKKENERKEKN